MYILYVWVICEICFHYIKRISTIHFISLTRSFLFNYFHRIQKVLFLNCIFITIYMSYAGCHSSLSRPYQILLYWILTEKLSERMDWLWLRWAARTCSCSTLWYMLCLFARLFIYIEHDGCCPTCTIVCVSIYIYNAQKKINK